MFVVMRGDCTATSFQQNAMVKSNASIEKGTSNVEGDSPGSTVAMFGNPLVGNSGDSTMEEKELPAPLVISSPNNASARSSRRRESSLHAHRHWQMVMRSAVVSPTPHPLPAPCSAKLTLPYFCAGGVCEGAGCQKSCPKI